MAAIQWVPIRSRQPPTGVVVSAAVLTAVGIARFAAAGSWFVILFAAGAVVAVPVLLVKPRWAIVALLLISGTLLSSRFGSFDVAGIRSDIPEVVLVGLIAGFILRHAINSEAPLPRLPRLAFAPVGLVAAAMVGATVALGRASSFGEVLGPTKTFLFWLLVLPIASELRSADDVDWLERVVLTIAIAAAGLVLVLAAVGIGIPSGEVTGITSLGVYSDATRYRPAALQLIFLASFLLAHRASTSGWSFPRGIGMALLLLVQAISFNRSTWVALAACLTLYALFRPGPRKPVIGLATVLVLVSVAAVSLALAGTGVLGPAAETVALRARSVVDSSVFEERSQQLRNKESAVAIAAIQRSPLLGVGLNQPFGARAAYYSQAGGVRLYSDTLLLHNTYLKLWLETGAAGMVALLVLALATLRVVRTHMRTLPARMGSRSFAAGLCLLGFAMQAVYQTKLYHRPTLIAVSAALGLIVGTESARRAAGDAGDPYDTRTMRVPTVANR